MFNWVFFFILLNESINNNNPAVIIDGPDGVLISKDANRPIKTDNNPPIIENITICIGLSEIFLAIAAGRISIPVINNKPTILMDIAIIAANNIVNIALYFSCLLYTSDAADDL